VLQDNHVIMIFQTLKLVLTLMRFDTLQVQFSKYNLFIYLGKLKILRKRIMKHNFIYKYTRSKKIINR